MPDGVTNNRVFQNLHEAARSLSVTENTTVGSGSAGKTTQAPPPNAGQEGAFPIQKMLGTAAPLEAGDAAQLDRLLKLVEGGAGSAFLGDVSRFLAQALIQQAGEQRQAALEERLNARDLAKSQLLEQASKMQEGADKMREGATAALISGLVAGLISMAMSVVSIVGNAANMGKLNKLTPDMKLQGGKEMDSLAKLEFAKVDTSSKILDSGRSLGQAGADIVKAIGSHQESMAQAAAKELDSQGSLLAAEAQYAQQASDMKKDLQEQMNDMIKQIVNFLREVREAEVDAMRAITRA